MSGANGHARGVHLELGDQKMVPLLAETLEDLVQIALYNIRHFDLAKFNTWIKTQPGDVQKVAKMRPPCFLYRVISDNERAGKEAPVLVGVVVGYAKSSGGAPAMCGVQILGIKEGVGSYDSPVSVPTDALEDVTEKAKAGKLALS